MKEYIASVMIISIICFVAKELLSSSSMASHISFVCGICVFCVAIMPLVDSIQKIRDISFDVIDDESEMEQEYGSIFEDYIENAQIDEIKGQIRAAVAERFQLDPSEIEIYLKYDSGSEKKLERVTVSLLGSAVFANSNEIKSYLDERLDCEIVVIVG